VKSLGLVETQSYTSPRINAKAPSSHFVDLIVRWGGLGTRPAKSRMVTFNEVVLVIIYKSGV